MGRDEIQKVNKEIAATDQKNYCLHGGKMMLVYKVIYQNNFNQNLGYFTF